MKLFSARKFQVESAVEHLPHNVDNMASKGLRVIPYQGT